MTNTQHKSKEDLANEIAKDFKEEERIELFQQVFQRHDESTIQRAYEDVKKVPISKIKKSQSALFFYLLNKYAEK
jgi:hypothetical protein